MKTLTKNFAVSLARVMPVIRTRTTIPMLYCVKVEGTGGKLTATCSSVDSFAAAICPCEGDLEPVCVPASSLYYLVTKAPDEIELTCKNGRLFVQGAGTARLMMHDVREFPTWPEQDGKELGINTMDLAQCISGVAWAPDIDPKLSLDLWRESVWVNVTDKAIECAGTDGKEFAYVKRDLISAPTHFLLPAVHTKLLNDALMTSDSTLHVGSKYVSTSSELFRVAIQLAEGKFMPVNMLLDQEQKPLGIIPVAQVLEALHAIKQLGTVDEFLEVRLAFRDDSLTVQFHGKGGEYERVIPMTLEDSNAFAIRFDLKRALSVFSHVQPTAKAALSDSCLFFHDGDWTFALALLV